MCDMTNDKTQPNDKQSAKQGTLFQSQKYVFFHNWTKNYQKS